MDDDGRSVLITRDLARPPSALALDLEFKLAGASRQLEIKQVRPYAATRP